MRDSLLRDLRSRPFWVVANKDKLPLDAKTGLPASCNDPSTWSEFSVAQGYLEQHPHLLAVGCEIVLPWCGTDLDWKTDPLAQPFEYIPAWAQQIITALGSYWEWSPSGKGCHGWFTTEKPVTFKRDGLEVYSGGRYLTVTFRPLPGASPEIITLKEEFLRSYIAEHYAATLSVAGEFGEDAPIPELDPEFNIQAFLDWLRIPVRTTDTANGVTYYRLAECPFWAHDNGWKANPSITVGRTLGFQCHAASCSEHNITSLMRWAHSNGRGKCPCPIWIDPSDLWEKEQHEVAARNAGILLAGGRS
jgi:hypothetical protein